MQVDFFLQLHLQFPDLRTNNRCEGDSESSLMDSTNRRCDVYLPPPRAETGVGISSRPCFSWALSCAVGQPSARELAIATIRGKGKRRASAAALIFVSEYLRMKRHRRQVQRKNSCSFFVYRATARRLEHLSFRSRRTETRETDPVDRSALHFARSIV